MITITHTHEDGTLIEGSAKGDGVYEILKGLRDNWRYFPSIRRVGIGQSRDRAASTYKINRAAEALRQAGHEVTVSIDNTITRSFAEAEAERYERAEDRAERYGDRAEKATANGSALWSEAREMASVIPLGQPMLVDHHSYGRDVNYRKRISRKEEKAFGELKRGEYWAGRAEAAEGYREGRESVPVTLRRIAKLEAEQRDVKRKLIGDVKYVDDGQGGYKPTLVKPSGEWLARLTVRAEEIAGELDHWRAHVAKAQEAGVKVWSREDFTKGDFVQQRDGGTWYEVVRVSAKSVSVPARVLGANRQVWTLADERRGQPEGSRPWTNTVPYDTVHARKSAAEMAEILAAAATAAS